MTLPTPRKSLAIPSSPKQSAAENAQHPAPPGLIFNFEDWLPYLDDQTIPESQKRELIETLWSIVIAFVDIGFEIKDAPSQSGGQDLDLRRALEAAVLSSDPSQSDLNELKNGGAP